MCDSENVKYFKVMIQRIQSIFLLLSAAFMGGMFISKLAWFTSQGTTYEMLLTGVSPNLTLTDGSAVSMIPLIAFVAFVCLLSFVALFLFKNRVLQMRITVVSAILKIGVMGIVYYYASHIAGLLNTEFSLFYPFVFPFIALIFDFLAIKNIARDEALVRAADRIR